MIEQIFKLTQGNEKTVEKVIIDDNIHYMHMILNKGECLPEHFSNAKNVSIKSSIPYKNELKKCL